MHGEAVLADRYGTGDGVTQVGDLTVEPPAELVAEDPEMSESLQPNRALTDHAPQGPERVGDWGHLDEVTARFGLSRERRMVERSARAALESGGERLLDFPAGTDHASTGAKWYPVEVKLHVITRFGGHDPCLSPCHIAHSRASGNRGEVPFVRSGPPAPLCGGEVFPALLEALLDVFHSATYQSGGPLEEDGYPSGVGSTWPPPLAVMRA